MKRLAVMLWALALPAHAAGVVVDKATNPPTPVPLEAPRSYVLPPAKQRSVARTRQTIEQRHDRAWAARQRRAIHTEREAVLKDEPAAPEK